MSETSRREGGPAGGSMMTPLQFAAVLVRHAGLVVGVPLGLAFIVGILSLLQERQFTSSASFAPQSAASEGAQLSGLAAQFGVRIRGGESSETPAFYADLLRSRAILGEAIIKPYTVDRGSAADTILLPRFFEIEATNPRTVRFETVRRLRDAVSTSTDVETGVVDYSVSLADAALAQAVANRILTALNDFNLERRQSQARAERLFVESRLAELEAELKLWEGRLADFLRQNRSWQGSPELSNEHRRLLAEVQLKRDLVSSLSQSFEQARIDEVRNTPVLTVIEPPSYPVRPNGRGTVGRVALALFMGTVLSVTFALLLEYFGGARVSDPDAYGEIAGFHERVRQSARERLRRKGR